MDFRKLSVVIESGNVRKLHRVLQDNPEVLKNPENRRRGYDLLRKAIKLGQKKIVKLLIEFGTDVNYQWPLEYAIKECVAFRGFIKFVEIIKILLENGAKLDDPEWNVDQKPPLAMASDGNIFQLLHRYGLNYSDLRSSRGENLLHHFVRQVNSHFYLDTHGEALQILDSGVPVDEPNRYGYTPLLSVIRKYKFESYSLAELLIEKGADVNKKSRSGKTFPLYRAAQCNNLKIADLLLSSGADVDAKNVSGRTALHAACVSNDVKMINFLISKGANVNAESNDEKTPFFRLSPNRDYEECVCAMAKELARLIFEKSSYSEKNLYVLTCSPQARDYFNECLDELDRMSRTVISDGYSYHSLLMMSKNIEKAARLVENQEFVIKFQEGFSFNHYKSDLQSVFSEAVRIKDALVLVKGRLKSTFGESLPFKVIKKLAKYVTLEDLPSPLRHEVVEDEVIEDSDFESQISTIQVHRRPRRYARMRLQRRSPLLQLER